MMWELHAGGSIEVLSALMSRIESTFTERAAREKEKQGARRGRSTARRHDVAMGLGMTPTRANSPLLSRGTAAVIQE